MPFSGPVAPTTLPSSLTAAVVSPRLVVNTFKQTLRGGISSSILVHFFLVLLFDCVSQSMEQQSKGQEYFKKKSWVQDSAKFGEKRCEVECTDRTLAQEQANADQCAERAVMCLSNKSSYEISLIGLYLAKDYLIRSQARAHSKWSRAWVKASVSKVCQRYRPAHRNHVEATLLRV